MFAMKKLILAAFAIAAVVATSGNADAAFAIRILSGSTELARINDNNEILPSPANTANFADFDSSAIGINGGTLSPLNTSFSIGSFSIRGFTGNIGSSGPTVSIASLNLGISSSAAGSITFEFSRTGYSFPSGGQRQVADSFTTNASGGSNTSVSYQSFLNSDNALFSTVGAVSNGLITLNSIPSGPSGGNLLGTLASAGTFSITTRTTFTFTGARDLGTYTSRTEATPPANIVPAPAGLLLSLLGLPALAFARRFRRAVPVQA